MNDLERELTRVLRAVGEGYSPEELATARERLRVRRKRRRVVWFASYATVAAAAVAVVVVLQPSESRDPEFVAPPPASLSIEAVIDVGDMPSAIAAQGSSSVWVANEGDRSIMHIDTATNRVTDTIDVPGAPEEVVVATETVWVATSDGDMVGYNSADGSNVGRTRLTPGPQPLDIAVHADSIWVSRKDPPAVVRLGAATGDIEKEYQVSGIAPSDVAIDEAGQAYALEGLLGKIAPVLDSGRALSRVFDREGSRTGSDLGAGFGALWLVTGDDQRMFKVDPVSGDNLGFVVTSGDYGDVTMGENAVWLITGGQGEAGQLFQFDPHSLDAVGEPLTLRGTPVDVAVNGSDIWVVNQTDDTVTHLTFGSD